MPVPRLTFKLSLLLISLVMAAIALLGWSFSDVARSSFRQRLSFHRVHLVTFLAGEIAVSLEKSPPDTSRAMDMIDGLSKEVALSVTLRAADGTVIHHTGESPIPITSEALEAIRQTGFSLAPGLMMNYPALITVPVRRQRLDGYLQVGYPPALYGLPLEPLALRVGLVAMGLTLFSIVLAIWFTRPLRVLSASIQRIASGDLEHRVAITSRDEFGEVASAAIRFASEGFPMHPLMSHFITENRSSYETIVQPSSTQCGSGPQADDTTVNCWQRPARPPTGL